MLALGNELPKVEERLCTAQEALERHEADLAALQRTLAAAPGSATPPAARP